MTNTDSTKGRPFFFPVLFGVLLLTSLGAVVSEPLHLHSYIQVCFTPSQDCTAKIIQALDKAKKTVLIQAYSFTSEPIMQHLILAKNRGLIVKVILDKSQKTQRYSVFHVLLREHIPVWIDYKPAIAHNKIMIIDEDKVITGSFNFTKAAQEKNTENLLIIKNSKLAASYTKNWQRRQAVSKAVFEKDSCT